MKKNIRWVLPPFNLSQPIAGEGLSWFPPFTRFFCSSRPVTHWTNYHHWMSSMWGYRRHTPSANDIACITVVALPILLRQPRDAKGFIYGTDRGGPSSFSGSIRDCRCTIRIPPILDVSGSLQTPEQGYRQKSVWLLFYSSAAAHVYLAIRCENTK